MLTISFLAGALRVAGTLAAVGAPLVPPPQPPTLTVTEHLSIVGTAEKAAEVPGSVQILGPAELERQNYTDIHRVLAVVPGVYVQEEDGLGLRPNIGMRATGVERSSKITLLEDGVLIAPAPYTAPAAYYFPSTGRLESVEVRKGSAAIQQGPFTTGGAINLITASVPGRLGLALHGSAGEYGSQVLHARAGDTRSRMGWLLQSYHQESSGFKQLDGGGNTGTAIGDLLGKLRFDSTSGAPWQQSLELKLGRSRQRGRETYLGLTGDDFAQTPFRRYAGSAADGIRADHDLRQARWVLRPRSRFDLVFAAYDHDFFRDWFKNESTLGVSNAAILESPDRYSQHLAILRGEVDSDPSALTVRHNRRSYASRGVQTLLTWSLGSAGTEHDLEIGARLHKDDEDRFQHEDGYQMHGGRPLLDRQGAPGSQSNRLSTAKAFALFFQDTIRTGRLTVTPGIRRESIDYRRDDFSTADPKRDLGPQRRRDNAVEVWIPGVGATWELRPKQRLFLGIHRGFSPPGAGQNPDTREERSLNFELGHRWIGSRLRSELVAFWNDYDNLLGVETVSGGGATTGDLHNGGAVHARGIEASLRIDLGDASGGLAGPLRLSYTFTEAIFQSSFATDFEDWGPAVHRGDRLPYLPAHRLAIDGGISTRHFGVSGVLAYTDAMRTRSGSGPLVPALATDAHWTFDLALEERPLERLRLFVQVRNAFDEVYLAARRPYGARPGMPRTVLVGFDLDF